MLRFTRLVTKEREMPSSREEEVGDFGRGDREVSEAIVGHCRAAGKEQEGGRDRGKGSKWGNSAPGASGAPWGTASQSSGGGRRCCDTGSGGPCGLSEHGDTWDAGPHTRSPRGCPKQQLYSVLPGSCQPGVYPVHEEPSSACTSPTLTGKASVPQRHKKRTWGFSEGSVRTLEANPAALPALGADGPG